MDVKGSDCLDRSVWKGLSPVALWGWRGHQGKTSLSSLEFTCVLLAQCPSALGDGALRTPVPRLPPPLPGVWSPCIMWPFSLGETLGHLCFCTEEASQWAINCPSGCFHGKLIPGSLLALGPLAQWGTRGCSCSTSQAVVLPVTFLWVRTSLAHLGLSC